MKVAGCVRSQVRAGLSVLVPEQQGISRLLKADGLIPRITYAASMR